MPTAEAMRAAGVREDIEIDVFDPEIDSIKLLEVQRLVLSAFDMRHPHRRGSIVVGLGMLTTLTREGVSTKVLKRRSDQIGRTIDAACKSARGGI